jgi:CRP/FNR family transcriptional regulator
MSKMKPQNLPKLLGRVWQFRSLKLTDLQRIVGAGKMRRFQSGALIFQEGQTSAGMFVLFSGKVHLCKLGPSGQEQIISVIEPVIMFNELAAIDGGSNPFTAMCVDNCLTWNIDHESFLDLVRRYPDPEIGLGLLRVLSARTRMLIGRCDDLSFRPVVARTAKLILDLSKNGEIVIDRRQHPIKDMSARIATVPEAISRSLKTLKEDGYIEYSRTEITVLNPITLADLALLSPFPLEDIQIIT